MKNNKAVSVVIATLGGKSLLSTLTKLKSGSLIPAEILVCIPESEFRQFSFDLENNIRIITTPCRGQVPQRAFGFRDAKHEYVLQLDDDLILDTYCLERLVEALQVLGPDVAVSPALIDQQTEKSVYIKPRGPKLLLGIYFWLINGFNGYQPGKVDKSGSAVGIDSQTVSSRFVQVEWLAGGCVLHRRKNLIKEDFWKRPGKAYYEDIFHSYLLRRRGIRLFIDVTAKCRLEVTRQSSMKFQSFLNDLYHDFSARRYYMKQVATSSVRIYIYYLIRLVFYLWHRIRPIK